MIIVVGSTNPAKLNSVRKIFKKYFRNVIVKGVKVESGVAEQPLSEEEMFEGALSRAKNALEKNKIADFGIGIEGGVHRFGYGLMERALVVIVDRKGNIGIGSSGGVVLPEKVSKRIEKGENLSVVIDDLFGTKDIGKSIGMFGLFTKEVVTRTKAYEHGVAFALSRFLHQNLFEK
ncbi:inosine/xanthosine triphosphatase [Candidatus Parcubacteria bacterium]|nr:MAG: inosine/xanthosine triphosphatase [Candidatus Parcubacteria bacterium]